MISRSCAPCSVRPADAIQGYLESLKKHGDPLPPPITEKVIEVKV